MFEFFRRKRTDAPKVLYFRSNQAAFEYTCKYMNNSLLDRAAVLAVVLGGNGTFYCAKVANDNDSSIPTETPEQILDHGSIENLCFSARTIDGIPALSVGDLVMYVAMPELAAMGKGTHGRVNRCEGKARLQSRV